MVRRFEYTDILGWSHSRYDTFQTCKRKYYYTYYSKYDTENKQKIAELRRLTAVPLAIGNISHKILNRLLKRIKKTLHPIDRKKFASFSRNIAKNYFDQKHFQEIYYNDIKKIDFEEKIFSRVSKGLSNFLESKRLRWLFDKASIKKDKWLIEPEGHGECRINGMKAYCKVDFLFPTEDEIHVIDWKTGKPKEKHKDQLKGYVTWVAFHFGKKYNEIKPTVAYLLPEYEEESIKVNESNIGYFSSQIREQTNEMYKYCKEYKSNIPLEKSQFYLTENEHWCKFCNFRQLCNRV